MNLNFSPKSYTTNQIANLLTEDKLVLYGKTDDWTISCVSPHPNEKDEILPNDVEILYPVFYSTLSL